MQITKTFEFEAMHFLPNHQGKCRNPHGHSYKVEVKVSGAPISVGNNFPSEGMVLDFYDISDLWKKHLEPHLDHQNLNEIINVPVTTAEWIATYILYTFMEKSKLYIGGVTWDSVTVWETRTGCATAFPSDVAAYEDMLHANTV